MAAIIVQKSKNAVEAGGFQFTRDFENLHSKIMHVMTILLSSSYIWDIYFYKRRAFSLSIMGFNFEPEK